MTNISEETMMFRVDNEENNAAMVINAVYQSLETKGYNPINQIVDIFYLEILHILPAMNNARGLIRKLERDEL